MNEDRPWYTYRQAAKRVSRHVRTIKKWRRRGLAMSWDPQGRRIVEHHTLLTYWRGVLERDNRNKTPTDTSTAEEILALTGDTP